MFQLFPMDGRADDFARPHPEFRTNVLDKSLAVYSNRSAAIGSSLDARYAGKESNINPTKLATPHATRTAAGLMSTGQPPYSAIPVAAAAPSAVPRIPPIKASATASTKNWTQISRRR